LPKFVVFWTISTTQDEQSAANGLGHGEDRYYVPQNVFLVKYAFVTEL